MPRAAEGWRSGMRALTTRACAPRVTTLASHDAAALLRALHDTLSAWKVGSAQTLLFSLSKSLPRDVLADAVGLLHSKQRTSSSVGFLSAPLPPSLVQSAKLPHAISLAALSDAVPFRSTIPGAQRIAVGRVLGRQPGKPNARAERLGDNDWRTLWGKENIDLSIPPALATGRAPGAVLFASDAQPQGLLEGLDAHFPHASVLGTVTAPTPFETGRDHTLFYSTPTAHEICGEGAVGVALYGNARIERAKGNILSSLDHGNATQQFLRMAVQNHGARTREMGDAQVRDLSSQVRKEDEYFVGLYDAAHGSDTDVAPALIGRIVSGHPVRGTLCIETHAELGHGVQAGSSARFYAQFFRLASPAEHTPAQMPAAPRTPRCVFLTYPADGGLAIAPDPACMVSQRLFFRER
ncbi:hypothetical protein MVES_001303 [Malassezia vespertilionis]|uniref:FIST domain-containing protein n=1 Tax=Malassezia vespertilionis TaxID=2020962 RepID=A0A2N1JFE0_9BASI|nr:hypothetical protein MVES_001303 [Malassezia vespertilionis]